MLRLRPWRVITTWVARATVWIAFRSGARTRRPVPARRSAIRPSAGPVSRQMDQAEHSSAWRHETGILMCIFVCIFSAIRTSWGGRPAPGRSRILGVRSISGTGEQSRRGCARSWSRPPCSPLLRAGALAPAKLAVSQQRVVQLNPHGARTDSNNHRKCDLSAVASPWRH